ncbi:hypothetical protein YTPLAS18_20070 [Nitrospira sp.]|nr:hypothetical protein YTPLAS18_20070 [Nitrospira sp.]
MTSFDLFMVIGFMLAAYSIVANDAIQTLGTFLSSNRTRPWWVLCIYICSVLTAVLFYGWYVNDGDISYGRLAKFPMPEGGISWIHALPPLAILLLTRFGIPVSTTFLVLTVFAPAALGSMLTKSLLGYVVAFGAGFLIYKFVTATVERHFMDTLNEARSPVWTVLQWISTAFLWSQWLIQDLANIFVYMPRQLSVTLLITVTALMWILHAYIFYSRGGAIQKIVTSKTNTQDIRSATIIDFMYALILLVFKEYSHIPMSTTWVFLGLLAGREFAISLPPLRLRSTRETAKLAMGDALKAGSGLAISIVLAFGLPVLNQAVSRPSSGPVARMSQPTGIEAATTPVPEARLQSVEPLAAIPAAEADAARKLKLVEGQREHTVIDIR